jgi:hypothetical protein
VFGSSKGKYPHMRAKRIIPILHMSAKGPKYCLPKHVWYVWMSKGFGAIGANEINFNMSDA